MKRRLVHEWRNWFLEHVGDDKYELIQKDDLSVRQTIIAKNDMNAEIQGQQIIKEINATGE